MAFEAETDALLIDANGTARCFPQFDGVAAVHVVELRDGGEPVDVSQNEPQWRYADIAVGATVEPGLLILSGDNAIVWRISVAPDARLAGVLLLGNDKQLVTGLPAGTPLGRSYDRERNGRPAPPCGTLSDVTTRTALEREARVNEARVREAVRDWESERTKVGNYRSFLAELLRRKVDETALTLAQTVVTEAEARLAVVQRDVDALRARGKNVHSLSNQLGNGLPNWPINSDLRPNMGLSDGLFGLMYQPLATEMVRTLSELGPYTLASYQRARDTGRSFAISQEIVAAHDAMRAEGAKQLAALRPPTLPLRSEGVQYLAAPSEMTDTEALRFLAERGYLMESQQMVDYLCELRKGRSLALGVPPAKNECDANVRDYPIIILGPIAFPSGLCGANSRDFILPVGVPEPIGDRCHSTVWPMAGMPYSMRDLINR